MKLDVSALRYLSKDHFRVLTAIEMGMKNHEIVPIPLITSIAGLRHGGIQKIISHLIRNKLIAHDGNSADGYRLTYSGYDYLALRVFLKRGHIIGLGRQIGVGKESDIYLATKEDGTEIAIKFHRLGRTSFKAVKNKRDYLKDRQSVNWFYMSRLSALKEFTFMKALYERDFPTPVPIDSNRHAVCMSLVKGFPLYQVRSFKNSEDVYNNAMQIIVSLAEHGLVHCDYNEFNLLLDEDSNLTMIDFPQMISTSHENAEELFDRDVQCIVKFFSRLQKGSFVAESVPHLPEIVCGDSSRIDVDVEASGFDVFSDETSFEDEIFTSEEEKDEIEDATLKEEDEDVSDEIDDYDCKITPQDSATISEHVIRQRLHRAKGKGSRNSGKTSRNSSKLSVKGRLEHKLHY